MTETTETTETVTEEATEEADEWTRVQKAPGVLSVRQPWAWALVAGHKDVENRSWQTRQRGLLGIHAGRRPDQAGFRFCEQMGLHVPDDLAFGAVIGAVELLDVVQGHPSRWAAPEGFSWVVGRAFAIAPMPVLGKLGIFGAPPHVAQALADAVASTSGSASAPTSAPSAGQ